MHVDFKIGITWGNTIWLPKLSRQQLFSFLFCTCCHNNNIIHCMHLWWICTRFLPQASFPLALFGCSRKINANIGTKCFVVIGHEIYSWCTPKFLDGLNCESKGEDIKRKRSWSVLLGWQHFKGRGACWSFEMGIRKIDKQLNYSHGLAQTKQVG